MSKILLRPFVQSLSPGLRILFVFMITLLVFLVFYLLSLILAIPFFNTPLKDILRLVQAQGSDPGLARNILLYLQAAQTIGLFVLPSVLFSFLLTRHGFTYLGFLRKINITLFLSVIAASVFLLPLIQFSGMLNSKLMLPDFLQGLENWLQAKEDQARSLTQLFLQMESASDFYINMVIIAFLPALGEELFFRGVLQQSFYQLFRSPHLGIIITAIIFSALHVQFYGFLPRFLLGLYYGYLFFWTGSLWLPAVAHFVNNGLAVFAYYQYGIPSVEQKVEELASGNMLFGSLLLSIGFSLAFLFLIRSEAQRLSTL